MPLDDVLGRWTERLAHLDAILDPIIAQWTDDNRMLVRSTLAGLQQVVGPYLSSARAEAHGGVLGDIVDPVVSELGRICDLESVADATELRDRITALRDVARDAALTLTTDERLQVQTLDDVLGDFAEEYRMSLILALTANYVLSQKVTTWQEEKAKSSAVGDHLNLMTMEFTNEASGYTIPMSSLTSASTGEPLVMTPANFGAAMKDMMTGGTPPPIYRMAYTQWFTTIHAAWEDTYRARLAAAHGDAPDGKPWGKNDIRSDFFNEVRLIRNDIAHKNGICVDSAGNEVITWVRRGEMIAPTVRDMLGMLDLFPVEELRRTPVRVERSTGQLPYQFDNEWIAELAAHVSTIEPVKKRRPAVVKEALDQWMAKSSEE